MKYELDDYDAHGYLKPSIWLILGWIFLARAWVVFIVASASRQEGSTILSIVYPTTQGLYIGLAAGLPAILMPWCVHLRDPKRPWLDKAMQYSPILSIVLALLQIIATFEHISAGFYHFNWLDAISLLILSWFILYVYQSKRTKASFKMTRIQI